ncbi:protein CMSS1 [Puma concolor]|uniref:Protein CMSS1 n=2 Tax=Felinae TaxID=338152 RepID=A0A6P6H0Q7_PUMCO|nr:protein CMSS1 [Puma concolor]
MRRPKNREPSAQNRQVEAGRGSVSVSVCMCVRLHACARQLLSRLEDTTLWQAALKHPLGASAEVSRAAGFQDRQYRLQRRLWTQIDLEASDGEGRGDTEMMQQETAPVPALSKKTKQPKECFLVQPKETKEDATKTRKRRKKKITDVLAKSEPKPGTPEDLQKLMKDYYSSNRSVIELEELNLPDSCFLKANDLTHSLSSYLKEICPKWVKLRKNHNEKKSVLMLIICSSALRALELIRSMTAFRGDSKVMKLFAKHIKVQEQVKLLEKRVVHLGVGTPGRIKELIKQGGLNLNPLKFLVFDWNWRDQKLRRMMDIPEIRKEVFELLEMGVLSLCKSESLKLGLF